MAGHDEEFSFKYRLSWHLPWTKWRGIRLRNSEKVHHTLLYSSSWTLIRNHHFMSSQTREFSLPTTWL